MDADESQDKLIPPLFMADNNDTNMVKTSDFIRHQCPSHNLI